jgi:hypothetical protein
MILSGLVLTLGAAAAHPASAEGAACEAPSVNKFLGNGLTSSGLKGVYSELDYIPKTLCTQGSTSLDSWSLSWVSLDGPGGGPDIWQGGYAKCPTISSCPWNGGITYYFAYYGRDAGVCGVATNTGFINLGNATAGLHFFQVSKVGTRYNFYIDETCKTHVSQDAIETCWPGATSVEWQNEMLNNGDQGGGSLSNRQDFKNNQYQGGAGWHNMNRALAAYCDANSYPTHWHCRTSSTVANNFTAWDDRFP